MKSLSLCDYIILFRDDVLHVILNIISGIVPYLSVQKNTPVSTTQITFEI